MVKTCKKDKITEICTQLYSVYRISGSTISQQSIESLRIIIRKRLQTLQCIRNIDENDTKSLKNKNNSDRNRL